MTNSGVLLIDKPVGPTSHDVVAQIRRKTGVRRVGHAGTLDPMASGLLLVCVGDATRVLEYLTVADKGYTGTVTFGVGTDTDDATGTTISTVDPTGLTDDSVGLAAKQLTGTIAQTVPAYSAVHVGGRRAYELARAGEEVEMPTRTVHIESFSVGPLQQDSDVALAHFSVVCSKGTYIRALVRDLGALVGIPAHMSSLRRISIGDTQISQAVTLDEFMNASDIHPYFIQPLDAINSLDILRTSDGIMIERLANGQRVPLPDRRSNRQAGDTVFIAYEEKLAVICEVRVEAGNLLLKPKKVLWKRG